MLAIPFSGIAVLQYCTGFQSGSDFDQKKPLLTDCQFHFFRIQLHRIKVF